jgi:lysophospholipase L1-like esterase
LSARRSKFASVTSKIGKDKEESRLTRAFSNKSSAWKVFVILLANLLLFVLFFIVGETAIRVYFSWKKHGNDTADWLIPDRDLDYKLNPTSARVNSLGIRHDELELEKPGGLFRVIVLGDSVAFPEDGFVAILRQKLSGIPDIPVEVINAAIPGYTTYQEKLLLQRDLMRFSPDLVILQYCLNDNHRFLHRLNDKRHWLITMEARWALLPKKDSWFSRLIETSYLITEIRMRLYRARNALAKGTDFPWERSPSFASAWQAQTWGEFKQHLVTMRDLLWSSMARLAVVAVPYGPQLEKEHLKWDRRYVLFPQAKISEICSESGIPLLDLHPVFLASSGTKLFSDGIHLTDEGHKLTANSIFDFLLREGLLPWESN